ncbi:MAG: hypothetical protein M1838_003153 [Thelocarpon superellum]|nr:MAG: hypothetical protein M1838_003153 [Thelocarpon superellum]
MADPAGHTDPQSAYESPTFTLDMSIKVDQPVGSMSISPCGRDVVLASRQGLHIIDLDSPYSPPRHLPHRTPWEVADVQWSPFASRDYWVISTSNQKALVWNLAMTAPFNAIEHVLHAHTRAITDINFSAHHPDMLATCAVDSYVHCWDLRNPSRPSMTFCDWFAGATQVKWNRQDPHILASSHDKVLRIWDDRKGAYPLRSIEAHDTKIYGVDWNRVRPNSLATCSLDKSIKIWDYENPDETPERVIRTPFPVWRSRHTPFGWGLLAMPQRGNNDLHLFDRRMDAGMPKDGDIPAVHRFEGHQDQVKEFLWRPRGNIVDGIDNREFQLVSWGTDRHLRLHHVDDQVLEKIGYQKGREVFKKYNFTRNNAKYKTFRDEDTRQGQRRPSRAGLGPTPDQGFSSALGGALSAGMKKAPIPLSRGWGEGGYMTSRARLHGRRNGEKDLTALAWMQGVRIGKKALGDGYGAHGELEVPKSAALVSGDQSWDGPDNLGDEITQVASKFRKVTFEDVDVSKRVATISVDGPWTTQGESVYTKVEIRFPLDYPEKAPPVFRLEKTSSIPDETLKKMAEELDLVAVSHVDHGHTCLEPVVCYLMGERSFAESMATSPTDAADPYDAEIDAGQSSSDDDEEVGALAGAQAQDMELSGTDLMGTVNANANVPLPKACGALFTASGSLVCFFPPKEEKSWPGLSSARDDEPRNGKGWRIFQGLGRLRRASPSLKTKSAMSYEGENDEEDSGDDSFTSSSDSSDSSGTAYAGTHLFAYTNSWRHRLQKTSHASRTRSTDHSQRSGGRSSTLGKLVSAKVKSIVSIHHLEALLPAKKTLAAEMIIVGDGASVCEHNGRVAAAHGFQELADVWHLATLILQPDVPLELVDQEARKDPILVIAQHATTTLKRRDSGLDLGFDDVHARPMKLSGRVKWGHHPIGRGWLIDAMFQHFERVADVQMLAMLSCVFSEPARQTGTPVLTRRSTPSMRSPAFSLEYFATHEMAWSLHQPTIPVATTPKALPSPSGTFGSLDSTSGLWVGDQIVPHSTGTTPPLYYKTRTGTESMEDQTQSLSSSPNLHHGRRSTSSLTSAFAASLSRPFSHINSSSPPSGSTAMRKKAHATESTGGVTWGTTTIFSAAAKASSEAAHSGSESEEERPRRSRPVTTKVTLHNQDLFDMEGCLSLPLLDPKHAARYQAYREEYAHLLAVWGLVTRQLEMLKYHAVPGRPPASDESLITLGKRQAEAGAEDKWQGLDVAKRCASCADGFMRRPSDASRSARGRCQRCGRGKDRMTCSLCKEMVRGTYAPCLVCGHVLHATCHEQWFAEEGGACPTGCGCSCPQVTLEMPPIWSDEQVGPTVDEGRLATVVEIPDSLPSWEGWEEISYAGRGRGLNTAWRRDPSRRASGGDRPRMGAWKKIDPRRGSAVSGQPARKGLVRTFSRDTVV